MVHLKPHDHDQGEIQQQQSTTFASSPQFNSAPVEYTLPIIQSNIPYSPQQFSNPQILPADCLNFEQSQIPLNYSLY